MDWIEVQIHTTNDAIEPVSNMLMDFGANGVSIDDPKMLEYNDALGERYELNPNKYPSDGVFIKAYFVDDVEFETTIQQIHNRMKELATMNIPVGKAAVTCTSVQETDWENEWKKYFKPVRISEHIAIVPTWETYEKEEEHVKVVRIDPGMAFGTGTHPTTILSVAGLEQVLRRDHVVIDVGSGSGILSIAAILLGAKKVFAYDYDKVAVQSTINNRNLNKMQKHIQVKQNDLLKGVQHRANVIVSNILAHVLLDLVDDAYHLLEHKGYFITSGIITDKAHLVREKLEASNFTIMQINKIENWVSIIAQKK